LPTNYDKASKLYNHCGHYLTHDQQLKFLECLKHSRNLPALEILDPSLQPTEPSNGAIKTTKQANRRPHPGNHSAFEILDPERPPQKDQSKPSTIDPTNSTPSAMTIPYTTELIQFGQITTPIPVIASSMNEALVTGLDTFTGASGRLPSLKEFSSQTKKSKMPLGSRTSNKKLEFPSFLNIAASKLDIF
jgi:hypothetical protein